MFSPSHHFASATGAVVDQCAALYAHNINAMFDAGMAVAEHYADYFRTLIASATVVTRQWSCTGIFDRVVPVVQQLPHIGIQQRLPTGMALAYVSDSKQAVGSHGATC